MSNGPIQIQATNRTDMVNQIREWAKHDVPEGTNYFYVSATLLLKIIDGEDFYNDVQRS